MEDKKLIPRRRVLGLGVALAGLCAGCAHREMADIMYGVVPASCRSGLPGGERARPGAKTASDGKAGDCLDAGDGDYLPRAIRVIWMHRVGSTARPRIWPS